MYPEDPQHEPDKALLIVEAMKAGYKVLTKGFPDLLLFKWDFEKDKLITATWVECKKTNGLTEEQWVMLSIMKACGLDVRITHKPSLDGLVEFSPEVNDNEYHKETSDYSQKISLRLPIEYKPLAEETYKKRCREYRIIEQRLGTKFEQEGDPNRLKWLARRILIANREVPIAIPRTPAEREKQIQTEKFTLELDDALETATDLFKNPDLEV